MRRLVTVLTTAACAAGLVVVASPAGAATKPHVSLRLTSTTISATAKATFPYRATNLRKGTVLDLQVRDEGTWDTISKSAKTQGTVDGKFHVDGPGGPGKFTLRVAAVRHGQNDAVSSSRTVYAYVKVPLKALCHGVLNKSLTSRGNSCGTGTADAGNGKSFYYVMSTAESTLSQGFVEQFGAAGTSCRSIRLSYVPDVAEQTTSLELHQTGAVPTKHSSSGNGVGIFTAKLTGKKFAVSVAQDDNDLYMNFNGSASCYTADGTP